MDGRAPRGDARLIELQVSADFDREYGLWSEYDVVRKELEAEVGEACTAWWLERWRLALAYEAKRPELGDPMTRDAELERMRRSARIEVVRDAPPR